MSLIFDDSGRITRSPELNYLNKILFAIDFLL